jgi:hypothetical protein
VELSVRKPPYVIPSYSLTGDLLSFLRCGLQYRYGGLGKMPATRPAQLWFGQFIHGVLEEAYRRYRRGRDRTGHGQILAGDELAAVLDLIARRLAANGLRARNADLEAVGRERAIVAVTELGPELFPIINEAEIPLNGTRRLPIEGWPAALPRRESDRYEMAGIVDVITEIQLDDPALATNRVVRAIVAALSKPLPSEFEVIVDYKGMRRPPLRTSRGGPDYWSIYEWQLQTYARLRSVQPNARPVLAGTLVFLNELRPTWSDIEALRREVTDNRTDVVPVGGSDDERQLGTRRQRGRGAPPPLSFEFRLDRALRVIPVSPATQSTAASHFDRVVFHIEVSRARERVNPHIISEWPTNASDDATCVACDWRTICPEHPTAVPSLPAEEA